MRSGRTIVRMDRTSPVLDALTTRVKQRVLAATLLRPERSWYLHELARELGMPASSVQHELRLFAGAGLLTRRRDGNRVYYQADRNSPVFRPLAKVWLRTAGLADVVRNALQPLAARLEVAFLHGSVARGAEAASSDVDLMLVGRAALSEVAGAVQAAEKEIGRSINLTVYTSEELRTKLGQGHPLPDRGVADGTALCAWHSRRSGAHCWRSDWCGRTGRAPWNCAACWPWWIETSATRGSRRPRLTAVLPQPTMPSCSWPPWRRCARATCGRSGTPSDHAAGPPGRHGGRCGAICGVF